MALFIRTARWAAAIGLICVLYCGAAGADPFVSKEWGFSAAFPGEPKQSSEPLQSEVGNGTIISFICDGDPDGSGVIISYFPRDFFTKTTMTQESWITAWIDGTLNNLHGKLLSKTPYDFGGAAGYEVTIDAPSMNAIMYGRIFVSGDRSNWNFYIGPTGPETQTKALAFLSSFKLL
jgi:hypothetical protein